MTLQRRSVLPARGALLAGLLVVVAGLVGATGAEAARARPALLQLQPTPAPLPGLPPGAGRDLSPVPEALAPLVPPELAPLPLPSASGQALLFRSRQRADYGSLSQEFLTQATLSYCGVASSVMVLNSLAVPAPAARGYGSYRFWTQDNLFEAGVGGPDSASVQRRGMTLDQLRALLAGRGVQAEAIEGSSLSLPSLRQLLRRNLADGEDRVLVNYLRRDVGQAGGGHIAPLAAFDDSSDRVLILDVARYRYPAAWVPLRLLWQAMRGIDSDSGRSRGLVLVRRLTAAAPAATAAPPPPGSAQPPGPN